MAIVCSNLFDPARHRSGQGFLYVLISRWGRNARLDFEIHKVVKNELQEH